ncbi:MAG: M20/M25/M40 family metallo-hydrolase [Lysobacterales bacterium]|nr:MAG: M20/M25/M40 family metallo-hydrolase [Xanthomonadales bacterium]
MDTSSTLELVRRRWDDSIIPELVEYVRIPNKSPMFDPDWERHGHMEAAVQLMYRWAVQEVRDLPGARVEILRLPGRTPLLLVDVPGAVDDCVLLYGHLDKQPEFTGWSDGLEPWSPVLRDGKLYGRGGADDGYALYASLTAIRALREQGLPHARCVVLIEASEESGSPDLVHHIDALGSRLGTPTLVVCLDAECGNYEQLWCTTSLRGNLIGSLRVEVLAEGVHSGTASGIVPSSFRILRELLARLEDANSGAILLEELNAPIPPDRLAQARAAAAVLGDSVYAKFPFVPGMRPVSNDPYECLINNNWRPTLSITGADGLPAFRSAGNVLRPQTTLKLSFRLPPTLAPGRAAEAIKRRLEQEPPYGARVSFAVESAMGGWNAPALAPWLERSMQQASRDFFGRDAMYMGTGGSIPFMGMLGERFPGTQFLVTGVLGPQSNAHGPNEFLHLECARRLTACVSRVLADHGVREGARRAA